MPFQAHMHFVLSWNKNKEENILNFLQLCALERVWNVFTENFEVAMCDSQIFYNFFASVLKTGLNALFMNQIALNGISKSHHKHKVI